MKQQEGTRAPRISGINVAGEAVEVDFTDSLMNVVVFFEPVSRYSLDFLGQIKMMASRYERLSVGFHYVMEPRLSCMLHADPVQKTLDRLRLPADVLFDANNLIALQADVQTVPTALIVDSNSFLVGKYQGEISMTEIERTLQARLARSGYRDDLPMMQRPERACFSSRSSAVMRQMGYANGDYVFGNVVVPESDQEFQLPDFYLLNTIYPFGAWHVSRDFIEGRSGSTLYVSCGRDESVYAFAGTEKGTSLRLHTSMESSMSLSLGKDVKREGGAMQMEVGDHRPYEILSNSGDTDLLVSLQVMSGMLQLYSVEFCPQHPLFRAVPASKSFRA